MMKRTFCGLLSLLLFLSLAAHAEGIYNVKKYGARGNGKTMDSPAIQRAIDACHKAGGGTILVPAGTYLSATIVLKDNVTLHLEKDALILGTTDYKAYDNPDPFTEGLGIDVGWALMVAIDARNVTLEGEGTIDGQGSALKARHILEDTRPEGQRWGVRPFLLRWVRCENVKVQGVTLKYAGAWTSHYFQCRHVTIDGVTIRSFGVAHNDGINIDGCQHVRISNCDIVSGDDALCFKTTSSKMGCDDIVVTDMKLKSNQAGIKMGTESMAGFENIKVSRCHIYDTRNGGIKLFSVDGAHLRNVEISDITMNEVRTPMLFRLGARLSVFRKNQDSRQPVGVFENVTIRNVDAVAADKAQLTPPSGILITGIPGHYITNLTLENIHVRLLGTGTREDALAVVPEAVDQYPEVKTFGPKIPAYGVWARHVKGLKLKNVTFELKNPDARPEIICEDGDMQIMTPDTWQLASKDRNLRFVLENKVVEGTGALYYSVYYKNTPVIEKSLLGLVMDDEEYGKNAGFVAATPVRSIVEPYQLKSGKQMKTVNDCREQTFTFSTPQGKRFDFTVRVYDDGVAFRYGFPDTDSGMHTIRAEHTEFAVPVGDKAWIHPYDSVTFSNKIRQGVEAVRRTTVAHQLALAVVFESGFQCFADRAEAYLSLPRQPRQFLKDVPAAWDESCLLAGYPGDYAVVARRCGQTWFIGGINGKAEERVIEFALPAQCRGKSFTLITDGKDKDTFDCKQVESKDGMLKVKVLPGGGFAGMIETAE